MRLLYFEVVALAAAFASIHAVPTAVDPVPVHESDVTLVLRETDESVIEASGARLLRAVVTKKGFVPMPTIMEEKATILSVFRRFVTGTADETKAWTTVLAKKADTAWKRNMKSTNDFFKTLNNLAKSFRQAEILQRSLRSYRK
uniref:RxLR effector protein n=1 Tax=Peronospora matthiolae TaxID=2874970 RepID=A0AAV1UNT9_9STRA